MWMQKGIVFLSFILLLSLILHPTLALPLTENPALQGFALGFLQNVAQVNMTDYHILSFGFSQHRRPSSWHNETTVGIIIGNNDHNLSVHIILIDGKFWTYDLDIMAGEIRTSPLTFNKSLILAGRALEAYSRTVNVTYPGKFSGLISKALETQQPTFDINGTIQEVIFNETYELDTAKISWTEKLDNQYTSPFRSMYMSVSKAGFVRRIIDNLGIYCVPTTAVNFQKEEAINISQSCISDYGAKYDQKIAKISATFGFIRDSSSWRGDDLAIYPTWDVIATYDKVNNESIIQYEVVVWADNGQIAHFEPMYSSVLDQNTEDLNGWLPFVLILSILVIVSIGTYFKVKRGREKQRKNSVGARVVFGQTEQ